jgi:hypothetical protein
MSKDAYEVKIADVISVNLAFREFASDFIDALELREEPRIIVDFSGVTTISRGFAHEYQVRRGRSAKIFSEINVPNNVKQMFAFAMDYRKEPRFPELADMKYELI